MLEGYLIIDKPEGITSAAVIRRIKNIVSKEVKIGHAGTLDPNVTGVLPLALGRATKAFAFLDYSIKKYDVSMKLGIATDTEDIWGTIVAQETCLPLDELEILNCLQHFIGEIKQIPPMYSAKKIEGKKLYEHARKGEVVERMAHSITIHSIASVYYEHPHISFEVTCSRGTYIRTLCSDIALKLGTIGTMTRLRRLSTAGFDESMSYSLDDILTNPQMLHDKLLPTLTLFKDYPRIEVDSVHAKHLTHGVKVNLTRFIPLNQRNQFTGCHQFAVFTQQTFIGIALLHEEGVIYMKQLFISPSDLDDCEVTL